MQVSEGANDIVLVTGQGRAIRFAENDVPSMGRVSQGVKGIQLRKDDGGADVELVSPGVLVTTAERHFIPGVGMTRELAQEWTGRRGIRINAVAPGCFMTEVSAVTWS
mgnify:CR=1 FL=1